MTRLLFLLLALVLASLAGMTAPLADWQSLGGVWRVDNGEITCLQSTFGWGNTQLLGKGIYGDCTVKGTFAKLPREAGFLLRYQDADHWTAVTFYNGEVWVYLHTPQGTPNIKRVEHVYTPGDPVTAAVTLTGKTLQVRIGDKEIIGIDLPTAEQGRIGLMAYGAPLNARDIQVEGEKVKDAPVAEFAKPFQEWDDSFLVKELTAEITPDGEGAKITGHARFTPQSEVAEKPAQVRWTLRAFWDDQPLAETTTPVDAMPVLTPTASEGSLTVKTLPKGLYLLTMELAAGDKHGIPLAVLLPYGLPKPDPETLKWSADTRAWQFHFTGTRANCVELARRYAEYYEPRLTAMIMGSSRELDTALSTYAALYGQTGEKQWAEKYRHLLLDLALTHSMLEGLEYDPTTQNDLFPSYRFMREKGVFSAAEQNTVEAWGCWLIPHMTFGMQHANHGRYAQLSQVLKGTAREGKVDSLFKPYINPFAVEQLGGNDSFGYDRIDWKHQMFVAEAIKPEALQSPTFAAVSRAYFLLWTPLGLHPGYGDHTGASVWDPIVPEWMAAHHLRNPQYKAIAINALQFALDHNQLREQGSQPALFSLWQRADDTLQPTKELPEECCTVPENAPDKVVLRDGDAFYLLLDLWGGTGHNHFDQGAVNWLIWGGNIWMADTNYGVHDTQRHNLLWLEGAKADQRVSRIEPIAKALDGMKRTIATSFTSDNYGQPGVHWTRRVEYLDTANNQQHLVITDSLTADKGLTVPVKLLWHLRGEARLVSPQECTFIQNDATLNVRITGGAAALQPYEEPGQLNVGTGCPPDSYQLCWGQPYSALTIAPEAKTLEAGQTITLRTEFSLVRKGE